MIASLPSLSSKLSFPHQEKTLTLSSEKISRLFSLPSDILRELILYFTIREIHSMVQVNRFALQKIFAEYQEAILCQSIQGRSNSLLLFDLFCCYYRGIGVHLNRLLALRFLQGPELKASLGSFPNDRIPQSLTLTSSALSYSLSTKHETTLRTALYFSTPRYSLV